MLDPLDILLRRAAAKGTPRVRNWLLRLLAAQDDAVEVRSEAVEMMPKTEN
jgi:hypothetical protein